MRKRDVSSGILRYLKISKMIPRRHEEAFYGILFDEKYKDASSLEQSLIFDFAWLSCRLFDCFDSRYLFGEKMELVKEGELVTSQQDRRDKEREREVMIPLIQKSKYAAIAALKDIRKKTPQPAQVDEQSELDKVLSDLSGETNRAVSSTTE